MKKQKHIIIVSQYFYPEQFRINDIATEWKKEGYNITVVTGIPNYPCGEFYKGYSFFKKRKDSYNGVNIIRLPIIPRGKNNFSLFLNYLSFVVSGFFWSQFTKVKADYIFNFALSPFTQAKVGVWYSKRFNIPSYIYVQDLWPESIQAFGGVKNGFILKYINKMVDNVYSHSDKILVTSNSFKKNLINRNCNFGKIYYFPQYAESFYKITEEKSNLIIQDGYCNITFTGNIGKAQGLDILPRVAAILKSKKIMVHFNIVGSGRNKEFLEKLIIKNNVSEYFNFVGFKKPQLIPAILSSSDCAFISFLNFDLFKMTIPAKLQSYLACGIPIIASAEGETKAIIEKANCGYCSDFEDEVELSNNIEKFLNLSILKKQQMGRNAFLYNEEHFEKKKLIKYSIDLLFK